MMHRLLLIIFVSIFMYPNLIIANDLVGPKIYNLQLGMPSTEAKPIIEELGSKYNMECKEFPASSYEPIFVNDKEVKGFGNAGYQTEIFYKDNTIIGYTLPFKVFNLGPGMKIDVFLQELANHYNLSLSCSNRNCTEINNNLGYKVDVNLHFSTINVIKIQKTNSLQFK